MAIDLYSTTENLLAQIINDDRSPEDQVNVLTDYSTIDSDREKLKQKMVGQLDVILRVNGYSEEARSGLSQFVDDALEQRNPHPLAAGHIRSVADQITESVMRAAGEM